LSHFFLNIVSFYLFELTYELLIVKVKIVLNEHLLTFLLW